ncbi:type II toxin-antitoxin system VapC family toxin [Mucilaginibacter sp. McL0603]|uniref:type II toxin-antitoxin system VapC family toxin n=1 Tax=Mucilaginibacter sp. McL0603 TaxID=3415670 RepID=UPI003CF09D22
MAERFLIDTSAVIKYLNETLPVNGLSLVDRIVDEESTISFITEIELQAWNPPNPEDLKIYQFFISSSTIIGVDDNTIKETIRIRKFFKLKLPDALIAATAITNNMTLIADNDKDFKQVPELKYINPITIAD